MNLPILGTLSTLFTDAGNELKKLFEPWAHVSAAIFLGLALAFFYVPLRPDSRLIKAWEEWDTAWQLIVATLLLFSLAYLINTLGGVFLALAGGRFLRSSPLIGRALQDLQTARFQSVLAETRGDGEAAKRAFYRLAYEFPAAGELAPTRLGNVRASVAAYSMNQYGAHLDTVWPLLAQTLIKEDDKLLEQVRAEQTATTMLATLSVLLVVIGVAAVSLALSQAALPRLVFALALLPLAYGLYRAAVVRALGWGRLIRAALDLHLDEAGTKLGLRSLAGDPAAARKRWRAVSKWLAYGGMAKHNNQIEVPQAEAGWYEKSAAASPATLTCPPTVSASIRVTRRPAAPRIDTPQLVGLPVPAYDVIVLATHLAEAGGESPAAAPALAAPAAPSDGGFVMVSDTRLPVLPPYVSGVLRWANGTTTPVPAVVSPDRAGPDALLWRLPGLAEHGSGALRYTVAARTWLHAGPNVVLLAVDPLPSDPEEGVAVELRHMASGPMEVYAERVPEERAGKHFLWAKVEDDVDVYKADVAYDPDNQRAIWRIPDAPPGDYFLTMTLTGLEWTETGGGTT